MGVPGVTVPVWAGLMVGSPAGKVARELENLTSVGPMVVKQAGKVANELKKLKSTGTKEPLGATLRRKVLASSRGQSSARMSTCTPTLLRSVEDIMSAGSSSRFT